MERGRNADGGRFLNETYVTEMGKSMCGPFSSDLTSEALLRRRYRGVVKANSTSNVAHFTRATSMFDTSDIYIDFSLSHLF